MNEEREKAYESFARSRPMYLSNNVFRYHDTFPHPPEIPTWPETLPDPDVDTVRQMASAGEGSLVGNPDDVLKAAQAWESAGADQLVFGIGPASLADTLETIRLVGKHVIPKLDTDPVHRTTRFREAATGRGGGSSSGPWPRCGTNRRRPRSRRRSG